MEKLVRDNIPALIRKGGTEPSFRVATPSEYPKFLREKLLEEVHEFIDAESIDELVDVLEVIDELILLYKIDRVKLHTAKIRKAKEKGFFKSKYILRLGK